MWAHIDWREKTPSARFALLKILRRFLFTVMAYGIKDVILEKDCLQSDMGGHDVCFRVCIPEWSRVALVIDVIGNSKSSKKIHMSSFIVLRI